jgi:4-hydroxybenzoate polyprenyltransferase
VSVRHGAARPVGWHGAVEGTWRIVRPGAVSATAAVTAVGWVLGNGGRAAGGLWLACAVTAAAVAAANVHNDVVDVETDRVNGRDRPLAAGMLSVASARMLVRGLVAATLVAAAAMGFRLAVWAVVALCAGLAYSGWIQRVPVAGNAVVAALFANAVLFGAAAGGGVTATSVVAATEVLWFILGREFLKGIPDVAGDTAAGTVTVAGRWGPAVAAWLFAACAVLTGITAVAGSILTGRGPVHPVAVLATVTLPALLVARSLEVGRERIEVLSLVRLTALIWVSGSLDLLLLRGG